MSDDNGWQRAYLERIVKGQDANREAIDKLAEGQRTQAIQLDKLTTDVQKLSTSPSFPPCGEADPCKLPEHVASHSSSLWVGNAFALLWNYRKALAWALGTSLVASGVVAEVFVPGGLGAAVVKLGGMFR